jgi:hypothetical protein
MKLTIAILLFLPLSLKAQEFELLSFIRTNYPEAVDSVLTQMALDSLAYASRQDLGYGIDWDYGSFHSSNDGLLKIYHFAGEACGAYCNPFYQSIIAIGDTIDKAYQFQEAEDFDFNIDSIITLIAAKEYLAFGNHSGRPRGVEGVWGQNVVHCSIENGFQIKWSFRSTTSSMVEQESPMSEISYDSEKMTISYSYDWYDQYDNFRNYRVSGVWKFNGAIFEEQEKKVEYDDN